MTGLGELLLLATTLLALVATFVIPPQYTKHLERRRNRSILTKLLTLHSVGDMPIVYSRVRARRATPKARHHAAASLDAPPDTGLAAAASKHRRTS